MKEEVIDIIKRSWTKDTCYPGCIKDWSKDNPSLGQCAVTSLIVNDFFGGKIMRCMCNGISHYYNVVNNEIIDLTVGQFNGEIPNYEEGEERPRDYLLSNSDTRVRYILLLYTTKLNFLKYGTKTYHLRDEHNKEIESIIPGTLGGNKRLKIYGKLDCPSALRHIEDGKYVKHRVFFADEETAIKAGYRPCGVCMKKEYEEWKENHNKKVKKK